MTLPQESILRSKVSINDDVLFQEIKGEGVLLNLKTGVYLGLNPVGAMVWSLLSRNPSVGEILSAMLAEFDVEREQCLGDLVALLDELQANQLITLVPAGT